MASSGDPNELHAAVAVLGGAGLALLLSMRSICRLMRRRERETGRKFTDAEIDSLIELAGTIPALRAEIEDMKRTLRSVQDIERKLNQTLARSRRLQATDGLIDD